MKAKKMLIGSALALGLLTGAAVVTSAIWPAAPGYAAGVLARQVEFVEPAHWRGERRRGMAMICSDRRDRRIEAGLAFVEGFVDFTPEQTVAWQDLAQAVRAGSATIGETCQTLSEEGRPETAPERLALAETVAATALGVLQNIRPAFDRLYATLNDKQKKALDDLISHHGRRT